MNQPSLFRAGPVADLLTLGRFNVIMADPPWQYSNTGFSSAAAKQYDTMPTSAICAMPVMRLADDNAVLFLWACNPLLLEALEVMRWWGFTYVDNFAWTKTQHVGGFYTLGRHELLLVGVRGDGLGQPEQIPLSHFHAARTVHSRKPAMVAESIEKMYANARRLELFARSQRQGWTAWGNDAEVTGYLPAVGSA